MLVQWGDIAPPAFGKPPESTTLPTTKECEASSIWEKVEERGVCQGNLTRKLFGSEICKRLYSKEELTSFCKANK